MLPARAGAGAAAGAERAAEDFSPLGEADDWDILEDVPNGSAAALILLEPSCSTR